MKKQILSFLEQLSALIAVWQVKLKSSEKQHREKLHSLAPTANADAEGHYEKALLWALVNREKEDIKNIALTGPYGSGKSSILKTFWTRYRHNWQFLNISLATFKENREAGKSTDTESQATDNDLLRLIELSVLQQVFYHEKDSKIPDSRFKKIKSVSGLSTYLGAFGLLLTVAGIIFLLKQQTILHWFNLRLDDAVRIRLNIATVIALALAGFFLAKKSIRSLLTFTVNKLNIKSAEIEIGKDISKSILNNHLDEILYFFEATRYSVVIIEDLDRFEQTEIFTKLRELNLLINNSKKIKQPVTFIYAVRDNMFKNKDRTKFFDLIIPVIPVINFSNSNEKLLEILRTSEYNIQVNLIEDIALFIDDMRLLYNITNEFEIYHRNLDKKLDQNKLLAMIVYKNIFPYDFVQLNDGEGELHMAFEKKQELIKQQVQSIDQKIKEREERIKELEAVRIKDTRELRMLYILTYLNSNSPSNPKSFQYKGSEHSIEDILEDDAFANLQNDKYLGSHFDHYHSNQYVKRDRPLSKFSEIEALVDEEYTYEQRQEMVDDIAEGKIDHLKQQITDLEKLKEKTYRYSMQQLLSDSTLKISLKDDRQNQLVNVLLRNGYIDEGYLDYMSIFYEGSMTKEDRSFLLNIKIRATQPLDTPLKAVDKLMEKIPVGEFEQPSTLNVQLMDAALSNARFRSQKSLLLSQLSNESDTSIKFIDSYIDQGSQVEKFISELTAVWPNGWKYVEEFSNYTADRKEQYFKLIVAHAPLEQIEALSRHSKLSRYMAEYPRWLQLQTDTAKLIAIFEKLKIKVSALEYKEGAHPLLDHIYEHSRYVINRHMIQLILKYKNQFNEHDFLTRNFYTIQHSACKALTDYIAANIETYITQLYIKLDTNTDEPEEELNKLLNDPKLSVKSKEAVMKHTKTVLSTNENIDDVLVNRLLLASAKVAPGWNTLLNYFLQNDSQYDGILSTYINTPAHIEVLSKIPFDTTTFGESETAADKLEEDLLKDNDLTDQHYVQLLHAITNKHVTLDMQHLSRAKVMGLINSKVLALTEDNFEEVRSHHSPLHLHLLEKHFEEYIKDPGPYTVDEKGVSSLIKSTGLSVAQKTALVNALQEQIISFSHNLWEQIVDFYLKTADFKLSKQLIVSILPAFTDEEIKIAVLLKAESQLHNEDIRLILASFEKPISDVLIPLKRPLLPSTLPHRRLATMLKDRNLISKFEDEEKGIRLSTYGSTG